MAGWKASEFDIKAYWAILEGTGISITKAHNSVINTPEDITDTDYVWHIATLLAHTGHPHEAYSLRQFLVTYFRNKGDLDRLSSSLGNQALILKDWGQLSEAMALNKEAERICKELGNKDGLRRSLGNQALILSDWGQLDEAMALNKETERICKELGNKDGLAHAIGNQANILSDRGQLREAMALYERAGTDLQGAGK